MKYSKFGVLFLLVMNFYSINAQVDKQYEVHYRNISQGNVSSDTSYYYFIYDYPLVITITMMNDKLHSRIFYNYETKEHTYLFHEINGDKIYYTAINSKDGEDVDNRDVEIDSIFRNETEFDISGFSCKSVSFNCNGSNYNVSYVPKFERLTTNTFDSLYNNSLVIQLIFNGPFRMYSKTEAVHISKDIIHNEWTMIDTTKYIKRSYNSELCDLMASRGRRDDIVFNEGFSQIELMNHLVWGEPLKFGGTGLNFDLMEKAYKKGFLERSVYYDLKNKDASIDLVGMTKAISDSDSLAAFFHFLEKEDFISHDLMQQLVELSKEDSWDTDPLLQFIFDEHILNNTDNRKMFVENLLKNKYAFSDEIIKTNFITGKANLSDLLWSLENVFKIEGGITFNGVDNMVKYVNSLLSLLLGNNMAIELSVVLKDRPYLKIACGDYTYYTKLSEIFSFDCSTAEGEVDEASLDFLNLCKVKPKVDHYKGNFLIKYLIEIAEQFTTDQGEPKLYSILNWEEVFKFSGLKNYFIYKYGYDDISYSNTPFSCELNLESQSNLDSKVALLKPLTSEPHKKTFPLAKSERKLEFVDIIKNNMDLFPDIDIKELEFDLFTRVHRSESFFLDEIPGIAFNIPYKGDFGDRDDLKSGNHSFDYCFPIVYNILGNHFNADSVLFVEDGRKSYLSMLIDGKRIKFSASEYFSARNILGIVNELITEEVGSFYFSDHHSDRKRDYYFLTPEHAKFFNDFSSEELLIKITQKK